MVSPLDLLVPEYFPNPSPPRLITGPGLRDFRQYLVDESKRSGTARGLSFPRTTQEVSAAVQVAARQRVGITISGARTGITAGAVPNDGLVLTLERMNHIRGIRRTAKGRILVNCEAGVALADLQRALETGKFADSADWDTPSQELLSEFADGRLFYPPDPTETSASIGGTIACNASGAHSFRYGPTRAWVHSLEIVLADGAILRLERGRHRATDNNTFRLKRRDGHVRTIRLPTYRQPDTKNAAGYYARPGMDLVDLFIGSEGTLGIITAAELRVAPTPASRCLVAVFWENEIKALRFTQALRKIKDRVGLEAIEYMDGGALDFLRSERSRKGAASHVPMHLSPAARGAVFLDIGTSEQEVSSGLKSVVDQIEGLGGSPEQCWAASSHAEREILRMFRHALPEAINNRVSELRKKHPALTKLGTDMAVPDDCLERVVHLYRTKLDAAGLQYVIFGHIGDNHLHVNILPATPEQYTLGKQLYLDFAHAVVDMGGSPAAEHGIGKLKTAFLELLIGPDGVAQMGAVKEALDPDFRLGAGTLFPVRSGRDSPGKREKSPAPGGRARVRQNRSEPVSSAPPHHSRTLPKCRRSHAGDGRPSFRMAVCIKQVPDTADLRIDPETNTLIREGVESIFNPLDEFALEAALQIRERTHGTVTAFTMGPPQAQAVLRKAVGMGADAGILVSDRKFAGADTWATSRTLAAALEEVGPFDLVFCGKQAIDGDTAQVGPGIAAHMGIAQVTYVTNIEPAEGKRVRVQRLLDAGVAELDVAPPILLTVLKEANEPRLPSLAGTLRARHTVFRTVDASTLHLGPDEVGLKGSPTRVVKIATPRVSRKHVKLEGPAEQVAARLIDFLVGKGIVDKNAEG